MLLINPTARIVNPAQRGQRAEQVQLGRDRYNAGERLNACTSDYQRSGWMSELRAQADAATSAYLISHTGVRL